MPMQQWFASQLATAVLLSYIGSQFAVTASCKFTDSSPICLREPLPFIGECSLGDDVSDSNKQITVMPVGNVLSVLKLTNDNARMHFQPCGEIHDFEF